MYTKFWSGNLKVRDPLRDLVVDKRILLLRYILKE